jgi:hypothetical protein
MTLKAHAGRVKPVCGSLPGARARPSTSRADDRLRRRKAMFDVLAVMMTLAFFAANVAVAVGFDRLMGGWNR